MFITQSYFPVSKDLIIYTTHFFVMKILKKREVRQISIEESIDIDSKDFMEICRKCPAEPDSFLIIDTTIPSDNALHF